MKLIKTIDPCTRGVKLEPTDDPPITTDNGWYCESFYGDDGHTYERTTREQKVEWLILCGSED